MRCCNASGGKRLARDLELAIGTMNGDASAIDHGEQRSGLAGHLHLLVIVCRLQFAVAREYGLVEFGGARDGVNKERRGNGVQFGVGGIEQNEPMLSKNAGVELGVRVRERLAFGITLAQIIGSQRVAQQCGGCGNRVVHTFSEADGRDRRSLDTPRGSGKGRELQIGREQQRLIHFGQVVVLAGQPEDRHTVDAERLDLLRQGQRRSHFEERQQRSAEQSYLLAGDDGEGAVAQAFDIAQRDGRCSPGAVLLFQNGGHARLPR